MKYLLHILIVVLAIFPNVRSASTSSSLCKEHLATECDSEKKCNDLVEKANVFLEAATYLISDIQDAPNRARIVPYNITLPHNIQKAGENIVLLKSEIEKISCSNARLFITNKRNNLKAIHEKYSQKYGSKTKLIETFCAQATKPCISQDATTPIQHIPAPQTTAQVPKKKKRLKPIQFP